MGSTVDSLNQSLSVLLDDYVATATVDGKEYTSLDRSTYLNRAQKCLFNYFYDDLKVIVYSYQIPINKDDGVVPVTNWLKDFIIYSATNAPATSKIALSGLTRFLELIYTVNSVSGINLKYIDRAQVPLTLSNSTRFKPSATNPMCYVDATHINLLPTTSDNHAITYLKSPDYTLVADGSGVNKYEWDGSFDEDLKYLAVGYAKLDDGDVQGFEVIKNSVLGMYHVNDGK